VTHLQHGRHGLAVVIEAAPELGAALAALHPEERAVAETLAPIRQGEWVGGRTALRLALQQLQLADDAPLLRDDRGAPRLPPGAMGSISHKQRWAAALVAPHHPDRSLGLDLELIRPTRVDISRRVLTERELAGLAGLAELDERAERAGLAELDHHERSLAVTLRFSIKEAIYKAIDPWVRRYVGFREVELDVHDDGTAEVRCVDPRLVGLQIEATWTRLPTLLPAMWLCTAQASR
jgi:enterobactin synthetase component D